MKTNRKKFHKLIKIGQDQPTIDQEIMLLRKKKNSQMNDWQWLTTEGKRNF